MNYRILLTILIISPGFFFTVKAQKLDSLLNKLETHKKEDTLRLKLLNSLAKEYQNINTKKGVEAADSAITLGEKLNNKRETGYAYLAKAENLNKMGGATTEALLYCQKALAIFEQTGSKEGMAESLNEMGTSYVFITDYPKALENFEQALNISKQIQDKKEMGINLANIGFVYYRLSEYPKALEYYQKALRLSEQAGDKTGIGASLGRMGQAYSAMGDYPKALDNYQKSLRIFEQLDNKPGIAFNLAEMGNLYNVLSNSTLALEYLQKALTISEALNNRVNIAICNQNIGLIYRSKRDYPRALQHYQTSLSMAEKLNMEGLAASCLMSIGIVYHFQENYSLALEFYKRSLAIAEKLGIKLMILHNITNIGEIYRDAPDPILINDKIEPEKRYIMALEYSYKALKIAEEINNLSSQRYIWNNITSIYEKQNDYARALESYKKYIILRDSIMNNEKEKRLARLAIQNEYAKKEDSIKFQMQISDEQLKQQQLLAKQQEQKIILGRKELDLINKEKDLQKLAHLKTQADLKNEQLQKQQKIEQLTLSEKEKQLQSAQLTTFSQEKKLNKLTQQRLWLLAAGGFVLVVFLSLFFLYRTRLRQLHLASQLEQQKNEQQVKEAEFQHKLGDITLSALRSQMNPHFIFNCLNSIKLYAAQNDSKAASDYLTKFSRLIRQMLENSRSDRISLTNEIQSLELYIQMEAMRFKEKLKYAITVDKNIDSDYIEIPPLLIQPYVENAIWHGLMQKEEGGKIAIHLSKNFNDDLLTATVTDNGIGRKKATEIKSKSATKHKSYGMKVTSERIALINQVYNSNTTVEVTDLYDETGEAAGTTVVIQIPI